MAACKMNGTFPFRFSWGDRVRVSQDAPEDYHPDETAEVVGRTAVSNAKNSALTDPNQPIALYIIEFGDGSSVELPEHWLEAN